MSFTAWIKGRVVPINSVLGLREILNSLTGSGTGGAQTIADIEGLPDALNDKLETSLLKTTLAGDLDTDIPSVKSVNSALALKLDAAIGFTALADNTTSISKSSFAGKAGVSITYNDGNNKTLTWNDDLKDGRERRVLLYNSHATTIGITPPAGIGDPFPAYCPTTKYLRLTFVWDGAKWIRTYSGVWA